MASYTPTMNVPGQATPPGLDSFSLLAAQMPRGTALLGALRHRSHTSRVSNFTGSTQAPVIPTHEETPPPPPPVEAPVSVEAPEIT